MAEIKDINGREIRPGDYVAQRSFDVPTRGANKSNMRRVGKVVDTRDLRVGVTFATWDDTVFRMPGEYLIVVRYVDGRWVSNFDPDEPVTDRELTAFDIYKGPETSPLFRPESAKEQREHVERLTDAMIESDLAGKVLATPIQPHGTEAATIKEYLIALLSKLWSLGHDFNSKRPFGTSSWQHDVLRELVRNKLIEGEINEDGELVECDREAGNRLIAKAIKTLGES